MNLTKAMVEDLLRADMYRLLSLSFSQPSETNLELIEAILLDLKGSGSDELNQVLLCITGLDRALKQDWDKIEEEYYRLFVTKVDCPSCEGSYHIAERGPILGDVTGFYEAFKMRVTPQSGPPDSLKAQLLFMHVLALKKCFAREKELWEQIEIVKDVEKKFLNDHLGRWAPCFAAKLKSEADLFFYDTLADFLQQWMESECERFRINPIRLKVGMVSFENPEPVQCKLH